MFSKLGICPNYVRNGKCPKLDCKFSHGSDAILGTEEPVLAPSRGGHRPSGGTAKRATMEDSKKKSDPTAKTSSLIEEIKEDGTGFKLADAGRTARKGDEFRRKKEEKSRAEMKLQRCEYFFKSGTCRYGDRCYYSHVDPRTAGTAGRGGRGGRPFERTSRTPFDSATLVEPARPPMVEMEWDVVFERAAKFTERRVFVVPERKKPAKAGEEEKKKANEEFDKYEDSEVDEVDEEDLEKLDLFEQRLKQVNKDLSRLEPVRKALFMGQSLDVMFIIDCTGSMASWIEASKKEIKSIIECIRNQYFGIEIRVSVVAYRDHCDGKDVEEVFPFSTNVDSAKTFIS